MTTALLLTVADPASGTDPSRVAALALLAFIGWRLVLIALVPYGPHWHCKGTGKHFHGKHFRPCRGCKGTGRRLRLGRRLWNWSRPRHDTTRRRQP